MTAQTPALSARCIYCYDFFPLDQLGKEHVVPLNLGGDLILPHASCPDCGDETSAAEGHCARAMYSDLRAQLGIKSRAHRRARKDVRVFQGERAGRDTFTKVSLDAHPSSLIGYTMTTPGILAGLPPNVEMGFFPKFIPLLDVEEFGNRIRRLGGKFSFKVTDSHKPIWISRTLAKIGHSFAVYQLGIDGFDPLLPDLILGKLDYAECAPTYLVGGISDELPATTNRHELAIGTVIGTPIRKFVVVSIRLFSDLAGSPLYHVVAGTPNRTTKALPAFSRV
jgi:hypothetical protein